MVENQGRQDYQGGNLGKEKKEGESFEKGRQGSMGESKKGVGSEESRDPQSRAGNIEGTQGGRLRDEDTEGEREDLGSRREGGRESNLRQDDRRQSGDEGSKGRL